MNRVVYVAVLLLVAGASARRPRPPADLPTPPPTTTTESTTVTGETFDCSKRRPGNYPAYDGACESHFFQCAPGKKHGIMSLCAGGGTTFYDKDSGLCDYREYVKECGGTPTTTTTWKPVSNEPVPFPFDCSNKIDYDYPNVRKPCSNIYVSCSGGLPYYRHCPAGTMFDVVSHECLEAAYVKTCHGIATTRAPETVTPPVELIDCMGKADGLYTNPEKDCSSTFISCTAGWGRKIECPGGLKFDDESNSCLDEKYIVKCGGLSTTTTTHKPVPQDPSLTFSCSHLKSGAHVDPRKQFKSEWGVCSHWWIVCVEGNDVAAVRMCPEQLYYDIEIDRCDYFDNVPMCSGKPRPPTPINDQQETTTLKPAPRGFCESRTAGNYEHPDVKCSGEYIACTEGKIGWIVACPAETYYDMAIDACEVWENVPSCSGNTRPPVSITPIYDVPDIDPKLIALCADKKDGNYPMFEACSSSFVTCVAGRPSVTVCPADLKFSSESNACLQAVQVLGCEEFHSNANICLGRKSGFYPLPDDCTKFVFCANQAPTILECAGHLVWNAARMKCEQPDNVLAPCGIASDPAAFECASRPVGFYTHPLSCRKYYYCEEDNSAWSFECEQGYAFDLQAEECRPESLVQHCLPPRDPDSNPFCLATARDGIFANPLVCDKGVICFQSVAFGVDCVGVKKAFDRFILRCVAELTAEAQCVV